jgi:outer membrane protein TolC
MTALANSFRHSSWLEMTVKNLAFVFLVCVAGPPAVLLADQPPALPTVPDGPLLTADEAVSLALHQNRTVRHAELEAEKHDYRVSTARSRRLPQFRVDVLASELLQPFDFTFPAGSFGTYPGVGPIPSTEAKVTTPATFTTFVTGGIDLPLTHQYKIGLGIRATELGRDIAREEVRGERQRIAAEVRTAYLELVATQTAVDAARDSVKTLEEAVRVTARHVSQQTVLRADALEVDARLAKGRYDLSVAENGLVTQRERLNQLLGRDLTTPFRVLGTPEDDAGTLTLDAARARAQENRPELRQARLRQQQADYERRLARAEYIPDVSLSFRYTGFSNYQVLPGNVMNAGLYLTWEPFDWGRRRNTIAERARSVDQSGTSVLEVESRIAVEVGQKFRAWQDATLRLRAARATHAAAVEQLRVTTNRYGVQAVLVRDLLQAEARSTDTEFQYRQALSSYWSALAELRRAMGEE